MGKQTMYLLCVTAVLGLGGISGGQERDFDIEIASPPPVIDGEVDDVWATASVQHMTINTGEGPYSDAQDCSGCFRALYDATYLYVLIDVNDSELHRDNPLSDGWQDDSTEFYFDGNNTKAAQGSIDERAFQYRFNWNPEEPDSYNWEYFHRPQSLEGVEYMMVETDTGYRFEIRFPWTTLMAGGQTPVGQLIGIDCFINDDDDDGGREHQVAWHATEGAGWNTPAMWGTALIVAPLKASSPNPPDGAQDVTFPLFKWMKGRTAVLHNVYFGTTPELGPENLVAPNNFLELYYHAPGIVPGETYYWRVDEIEKDNVTIHTGDVWSFLAQPRTAYNPQPVDGSNEASPAPDLTWRAGTGAMKHQVYFSDSFDDVNDGAAAADQGVLEDEDPNFAPGQLEELATYYWRVDELGAGAEVVTGEVWSFTTYGVVDDFESYNDDVEALTTIFDTWIDGLTNNTGSVIGYWEAPFCEQTIVHGGLQSMPFDYNNVVSPYYSEGERDFGSSQDWTANGADLLTIHLRGRATNGKAPVYVGVQDAQNRSAFVPHPDPNVAMTTKWGAWKVPLSDFADAGVSVDRVRKLLLGVGDRDNPMEDGFGLLYIDDIYLTKPALVSEE